MKEYAQYISINSDIRFGKPYIKGTRIAVGNILSWLASDMSCQETLEDFPSLKEEHIKASLLFAANREAMVKIVAG